jgi:triacylglycerol lipase
MSDLHRVYFVPGLFGFGHLAGYDYFMHVRAGLERRFAQAGAKAYFEDISSPPTSSLRHRARVLARTVAASSGSDSGPIHLIGHSTGGLDTRLVLSPTANLGIDRALTNWTGRVRTAVTVNAPHYGTPLAGYFASVSGTRLLYALSLMTVVSLSIGEPSLAMFSKVLAGIGSIDSLFGGDLKLFSRVSDGILRFIDRDGRTEIQTFLGKIRVDQGAIVQAMPEAMDLFNAAAEDSESVRYGCIATAAPPPRSMRLARRIRSPYAAVTAAVYTTLYQFASQRPRPYPYAVPTPEQARMLARNIEHEVTDTTNDGVVPTLSMLRGELLWAGEADHLDVLGHFHDDLKPTDHVDWVTSGAQFTRERFGLMLDALAKFQLSG